MTAVTEHVVQDGTLTIRPLQPTIGAEISGVDLTRPLSDADRDQIKAAILRYKVVFFRDQHLDQDQHAAFARRFGPLYTHPSTSKAYADTVPAIHKISAAEANERHAKLLARQQAEGWDPYHSDTSWRLVPTWGAVLRAVNLPDVGGDTIWVDAGLAYDRLPEDAKERLEGLHVTHDYRDALAAPGRTTRSWPTRSSAPTARPAGRSSSSTSPSTRGSSGSTGRRAGSCSRSCMTSTASPSFRSGSAGARVDRVLG